MFGELTDSNKLSCFPRTEYNAQVIRDLKSLIAWENLKTIDLSNIGFAMCSDLRNWRREKLMVVSLDDGSIVGDM